MKSVKQTKKKSIRITKKQAVVLISIIAVVSVLLAVACRQGIDVTVYTVYSDKTESDIRLCVITDHHSSSYGKDQEKLIRKIDEQNPDVILIVGDLFDRSRSTERAESLLRGIGEKYTCFYTTGNHEYRTDRAEELKTLVRTYGVTVLDGDVIELTVNGRTMKVCGIDDLFGFDTSYEGPHAAFDKCLSDMNDEMGDGCLSVLLSHRPQQADLYAKYSFDVVVSGHNHGGQVRIPFTEKGLYTPTDGFFPEYSGGIYAISDSTDMIVSRGLCKNLLPRVFNPPELVIVDIKPE